MANELLDYFNDLEAARHFAEIFCLPHHHHHEKARPLASSASLAKMASSANFQDIKKG